MTAILSTVWHKFRLALRNVRYLVDLFFKEIFVKQFTIRDINMAKIIPYNFSWLKDIRRTILHKPDEMEK